MKTTYHQTEGWEETLVPAVKAVERAIAKGTQQGEFTFGNMRDLRYYADRLRRAADRLDEIDRTFTTPTERPAHFMED